MTGFARVSATPDRSVLAVAACVERLATAVRADLVDDGTGAGDLVVIAQPSENVLRVLDAAGLDVESEPDVARYCAEHPAGYCIAFAVIDPTGAP